MQNIHSTGGRQTIGVLLAGYGRQVPSFNAMRFLAASSVLVAHSILVTEGDQVEAPLKYLDHLGNLGLFTFFFISGFVISQSCTRSTTGSYLIRRAARIMPGLILVTCFCALLLGPLMTTYSAGAYFTDSKFFRYFLNIIFVLKAQLPGVFQDSPSGEHVNLSLWTLRHEIFCYVAILAVVALRRLTVQLVAALAVGASILAYPTCTDLAAERLQHAQLFLRVDIAYLFREGIGLVACFFVGSLYYFLRVHVVINVAGLIASSCIIAIATLYGFTFPLLPFTLGYVLIYLGLLDGRFCRLFQRNDYSYGMYIFAFPIQQSLTALSRNGMSWWMNMGLAFPVVLGLAALSWHLIERPSMRWARRLGDGRRDRTISSEIAA